MAFRYFERKEHVKVYHKYMLREPDEVQKLILSYLEKKKEKPFGLAVDVGCGPGQSTRVLAPHFQKVVGVDISESQIQEARSVGTAPNVSYLVGPAEKLPFENGSVDLITASVAAHWFNTEEFLREVDRVLKPKGCLALYCLYPVYNVIYNNCSESLTVAIKEAMEFLFHCPGGDAAEKLLSEYQEMFDTVPYTDKTRVTNILSKQRISIAAFMGFIESLCMFQNLLLSNVEAAKEFLQALQERLLKIMGVSSTDTELELCREYFCVLACKSP